MILKYGDCSNAERIPAPSDLDDFLFEYNYPFGIPVKPYTWTTQEGIHIPIIEMTSTHIRNCMKLVGEDEEWYYVFKEELDRRVSFLQNLGLGGNLI